jgi:flagellar hook-associated protein 3 FlgL
LLNQAVSLGTEGASSSTTASTQQDLATQVQALQAQLVAISNTEVGGVYVFSGDASGSPPYQVDTSSPPAWIN